MATRVHAAIEEELVNLAAFDGSYEEIDHVIGNPTDIAGNWMKLGVENAGERKRVVLIERSSLGLAYVMGDGIHFGKVESVTAQEAADLFMKYGLHPCREWHWKKKPSFLWEVTGYVSISSKGLHWWNELKNPLYDNVEEVGDQTIEDFLKNGPLEGMEVPEKDRKEMEMYIQQLLSKKLF
jgi:hypothetical protein